MAVNLISKKASELHVVDGVQLYVAQAGIKYQGVNDLTLMVLSPSNTVAGVFTQNAFCAAPVYLSKAHLARGKSIRALVINTGNANAGTGQSGKAHAKQICDALALQIDCDTDQVLPFSTGVILEPLPVDHILKALPKVKPVHWDVAAAAIMTTDTVPKAASRELVYEGKKITITGMAKGSGMIEPNMATMLAFIATDAAIEPAILQKMIHEIADETFNCVTVDGDTSTNDSFVLIATGKSDLPIVNSTASDLYGVLKDALTELALELATAIVRDGEGATKLITVQVQGAKTQSEAKKLALRIAHSPLIKVAFFASDANLGRIVCAVGNADIPDLDIEKIRLFLDNILVVENGERAQLYQDEDGARVMQKEEITIRVELGRGEEKAVVYTSDLSHDYIDINASYRS